jgi:hypothetical protein
MTPYQHKEDIMGYPSITLFRFNLLTVPSTLETIPYGREGVAFDKQHRAMSHSSSHPAAREVKSTDYEYEMTS